MLVCRTLGPPDVTLDGELPPAELTWRKHLALLIYLARSPRGRTREHLARLLWADRPEASARHSLNVALHTVRRHAGDASVETAANTVRLAPGVVWLDVDELEACAARGDWGAGARLAKGEFMEGFSVPEASGFEDWLTAERTAWRQRSVEVLARRGEELLCGGHAGDAVAVALRAAALDPSSDLAARAVMRGYALAGDPTAALEHFQLFGARIADGRGGHPDAETAALAGRVKAQRPIRPAGGRRGPAANEDRLPLIGREAEMRRMLDALAGSRATPRASALIVDGEEGMGKTSLIEELLARARLDGATVASARAVEADATEPWSGALALARDGLLGAPGLDGAPPAALAAFTPEVPEWGQRFTAAEPGAAAWPLGRALREVLRAAADERPVVLAVDDAQWLDRESLLVLIAALRDLTTSPVVLILGLAPFPPRDEVDELRGHLGLELGGVSVTLAALGRGPLHALARRLLPRHTEVERDRVVRRVTMDSAGTPRLAVELFRAVALGLDLGATGAADAVVAAIRLGYGRLSVEAQRVLAAAAVLGDRVSAGRLVRVLEATPAAVHDALDELEWQRWLVPEPRGYGFVANVVRQVIARDMLTLGQRSRLLQNDAAP